LGFITSSVQKLSLKNQDRRSLGVSYTLLLNNSRSEALDLNTGKKTCSSLVCSDLSFPFTG